MKGIYRNARLYISGPITNDDLKKQEANKFKFHCAEEFLRLHNFNNIVNPARFDDEGASYAEMLMMCLDQIPDIDVIVMLKNWRKSNGAKAERALAKALNKKIIYLNYDDFRSKI